MLRDRDTELLKPVKTYNEESNIYELSKWLLIFAVCVVVSLFLAYFAYRQLAFNLFAGSEPAEVTLADLEENGSLPGTYLKVGEHLSLSGIWLDDTYPIVSMEGTVNIPKTNWEAGQVIPVKPEHLKYRLKDCRILVRNPEELSQEVRFDSDLSGMIVGKASDLDMRPSQFEKLGIPNPAKVYILEVGRRPNVFPGLILGLISFACFAGVYFSYKPLVGSLKRFSYE